MPKFQKLELEARPVWPGAPVATPEHFRVKAAGGASFETLFTCMETSLNEETNGENCLFMSSFCLTFLVSFYVIMNAAEQFRMYHFFDGT